MISTGAINVRDNSQEPVSCSGEASRTMASFDSEGVKTVANMNGNEPSVAHDGVTSESAAELATPPVRSAAFGLLSAAEIWSTNTRAPAKAAAPIIAASEQVAAAEKAALEKAAVPIEAETPVEVKIPVETKIIEAKTTEANTDAKPRTMRERLVAAIWPEDMRPVETPVPATSMGAPLQDVAETEIKTGDAAQPVEEVAVAEKATLAEEAAAALEVVTAAVIAEADAAEPAPAVAPEIIRVPERATIENALPQFASAVEVIAGLEASSFSRRIAAQDSGPKPWPPRRLALALQGGGSFAAFTWGVLERLLEEPSCEFDAISGASAGAVNAALLVSGLVEGGREMARARLKQFWDRTMQEASFRSLMLIGGYSPAGSAVSFGPALRSGRADPFDPDLLREALARDINFAALQDPAAPRLLVAATRVRDGSLQIFGNQAITPDTLLASTCPPQLHCAVEIDGESYWDGGYGANPPLVRLVQDSHSTEVLVVQVTPARDNYIPVTHAAIDRRLDQITANSVLNAEIAALEWARDRVGAPSLRGLRLSRLAAENEIEGLAQRNADDLGRNFIALLHRSGRAAADRWLSHSPDGKPVERVLREGMRAADAPEHSVPERSVSQRAAEPELV
jgi:NTE family protein